MKYHSRRKVNKAKSIFINVMYRLGWPVNEIGSKVGISRATVYRYIKR